MRIVYSPQFNFGLGGIERYLLAQHPFDPCKYARAWRLVRKRFGRKADALRIAPHRPAKESDLLRVHSRDALLRLRSSQEVANVIEVASLARYPLWMIDLAILKPMRWAVEGAYLACQAALEDGLAVMLGGGFHHAKPDRGEGFCVYADIAIAVARLRESGALAATDRVVHIDLDAHMGNGVAHAFRDDSRTFLFDIHNRHAFPLMDDVARDRLDCPLPIDMGTEDAAYRALLTERLPGFLDSLSARGRIGLAIYNAGSDVVASDPVGMLGASEEFVLERDLFAIDACRSRGIPTVMVTSGGYTEVSHQLVAKTVEALIEKYAE